MRGSRVAALVVLLCIAPGVLAQDAGDVATLSMEARSTTVAPGVDSPAEVLVDVTFESQNPLDGAQTRQVHLEVDGVPDGWSASVTPSLLSMVSGDTQTVTVTVTVTPAAEADAADLVVVAELLPRGASGVPGVGTSVEPEETASIAIAAQREDPLTREFLETFGGWLWLVLAAAIVLALVAAKLVYDTRRVTVRLHAKTTEAVVEAGGRVAVPLRVENLTRVEDTVVFHVAPMPDGWAAHLPVPELDLDGHQSEELHLIIQAPKDVPSGSRETVGVSAHSAQAPKRAAELVVTAVVE